MPKPHTKTDRGVLTAGKPADANRPFTAIDWGQIQWRQVERDVRRLQHRIFMAKVRGDKRKVESLQRLLASSWSAKLLAVRWLTQLFNESRTPGEFLNPLKIFSETILDGGIINYLPYSCIRLGVKPGLSETQDSGDLDL